MQNANAADWLSWVILAVTAWNLRYLFREVRAYKAARARCDDHYAKCTEWSGILQEANIAVGSLYEQLAERYPDDVDIQKCRELYRGRYAQH